MQAQANSLSRAIPIGIGININRVIVEANDVLAQMLGYTRSELIGSSTRVFYRSDAEFEGTFMSASGVYRWRRKDGSLVDVCLNASPADPTDIAKGIVFAVVDLTRRSQAAEALRESEERFHRLADAVGDGVMIHERGVILDANSAFARLFGYAQPEELIGRNAVESMLTPESQACIQRRMERRETGPAELICVRRNGSTFAVETESRPVRFRGRDATLVVGRCIAGRKRAEEALRESEERYRALFDRSLDCVFLNDFEGCFLDANQAALDLLGYRREEIAALTFESLLTRDQLPLAQRTVEQILATGSQPGPTEYRLRRKDGSDVFVETQSSLISREGKPFAIQGIARDITLRKQAEEALRESTERFRSLSNLAPEGIMIHQEGVILDANLAFARLFGYEQPEDLTGRNGPELLLTPESRERIRQRMERRESGLIEVTGVRKDGSTFAGETDSRPVKYLGHDASLVMFYDVTERKLAREEQDKLQAQLHQAQKMESIGRLAGGVAHDFNNLLTVINGNSQLGMDTLSPDAPLRATMAEILKAGERAAGLTRQLLAFSRKQVLQMQVLDLNRVVEGIWPMLERLVGEDVKVLVALNARKAMVRADPHQLEQVVMNLAVNARDAMPGGGTLLIETEDADREGRHVVLAVTDNGTGMNEATRQRIFEPFFTTKEPGKGTGLGLPVVQGIVAQSGGHIDVCSEPGHGTTFKIYLPVLTEAAPEAGMSAPVPVLGGNETVLVVEDQAQVRRYVVQVLKGYGYRVFDVESAKEALNHCDWEHDRIHLLLTDAVMPGMSGRQLAERLKKARPGLKVLFMSGYTDDVILQHGILEEGVQFIEKPFSPEELARRVRAALGPPSPGGRVPVASDEAEGFPRSVQGQTRIKDEGASKC